MNSVGSVCARVCGVFGACVLLPPPAASQALGAAHQVRMLTEMLESYEREIESLEGSVKEAEEDLENTRSALTGREGARRVGGGGPRGGEVREAMLLPATPCHSVFAFLCHGSSSLLSPQVHLAYAAGQQPQPHHHGG